MSEQTPRASAALVDDLKATLQKNGDKLQDIELTLKGMEGKLDNLCSNQDRFDKQIVEHDNRLDSIEKKLFAASAVGGIIAFAITTAIAILQIFF